MGKNKEMPVIFLDVMHNGSKAWKALRVWLVKQLVQVAQKSESTGQISLQRMAQLVSLIRWKAIYSLDSAIYLTNDWVLRNIACVASVSICLVLEQRKTEERDSRFWLREKWNKSQKMKVGGGGGKFPSFLPNPFPLFYLHHFSRGLWLSFLVLCS